MLLRALHVFRYTYLYDFLGNKTRITKERRGLEQESGSYTYGYDALGRLSEIQKDGQMQTRYGYDAFGNRTWKEESGERTSYQYNVINQMVREKHGELLKEYSYDKRGNLTGIQENGAWKKQYVYGAINRLEEAVDAAGKQARYQYNGLGHRVGKQENVLPKEKLEKLDPQNRIGMEIGNSRQIAYTLDLTRQYNLLERTEESQSQRYFWDGNVAAYEENGERNYYLQDELGSPLRIEDSAGNLRESYGYGAFGEDLYQNQGEIQPFGYTGYQRDEIAGTYYAQAREYLAENGRFAGQDLIAGFMDLPFSMNRYSYCFNAPMILVDLDGAFPSWSDIKKGFSKGIGKAWNWAKKHKDDIIKVIGTTALVVGGVAITAATFGTGAGVFVGISAVSGATAGGVTSYITGGDIVDNICGGTINGTITAIGTLLGTPGVGNFWGGAIGSAITDIMGGEKEFDKVLLRSAIGGGIQLGMTMGGIITKVSYDVGLKNTSLGGIILNYVNMVYGLGSGMATFGFQEVLDQCEA